MPHGAYAGHKTPGHSSIARRPRRVGRRSLLNALAGAVVALSCAVAAAPALAAQVSCNPAINPSGTPPPGTVVAPGLRVISTQWGLGNCPEPFFVSARSANGTIWATDYANGLWKSTDDLRTLTRTYTATGYSQIEQVLPLSSGTILIVVRDASGNRHVLRSTDSTGTSFAATPVLDLPAGAQLHDPNGWAQIGGAVYIAEYRGGPPENLYRSTDDGQTWSSVFSAANSDEIHAVQADPYVAGRVWIMLDGVEDQLSGTQVGYSDDGGVTWTWVTDGSYPESRVVDLMFDSNAVYWATDSPDVPAGLFRYDRTTGKVTQVMNNLNGPFYDAFGYNGQFAQFSTVAPGDVGDQNIHIVTNGDGTSWSETTTPWSRDQTNQAQTASTEGDTPPDSQGRFWVSYFDLAGSPNLDANLEFQFDPTAKFSGLSSSFTASPNPYQVGNAVSFNGSGSTTLNPPLSYEWNFGDGSTSSSSATPSHTYSTSGPFTATLQIGDASGNQAVSSVTLGSASQPPTASTGAAPAASATATLYGDVTPNGSSTSASFQYGTTTSYGSQTATQSVGSGSTPQQLTAALSNLQPNTTYHYRLVATNGAGTTDGIDRAFTTPATPTSVSTSAASQVMGLSANANGTVNPEGLDTTVYFQYGTTTAYGSTTASQDAGQGTSNQPITLPLTGLSGDTTYHYQLVAVNQSGTYYGSDQTFATGDPPPAASTQLATFVGSGGATLNASVNPNGLSSSVTFEYGTTSSYGSQSSSQNIGSGTTTTQASIPVTGLQPDTTYHYRVDATNANGTTDGADGTFTTTAGAPIVTTGAATGVTASAAAIGGTVDPQFQTTTAYLQYGTSTSYGSQTSTVTMPGNLVPNPGCGNGTTTGWSTDGTAPTTFQSQTGWASVGPASCRLTVTSIPSGGYSEANVSPYIKNVTAGAQYSVSMDVNVLSLTAGQHVVLYVTWRDASGNGLGKVQVTSTTATGVTTLSGNLVAPANTAQAQVTVTVENAGTADLYFDNTQLVAAGTGTLQAISAQLTGLTGATTYHYRTVATSSIGTTFGPDQTFTTAGGAPPLATTTLATFVGAAGANLNASVNPNGFSTNVVFEYGTTSSYGSQSSSQNIGSGTAATPVSIPVTGLQPDTTYHYRIDATSPNGTTDAADGTFTTTAGPPVVTTGAASGVTTNGATIGGTVDPQFQTTTAYFQYGTSTSYGSQTSTVTMPGNLVPNPGCGNGTTTGWSTDGTAPATFQSQTGWASVGPASCRLTVTSIPSGGYSEANVSPYIKNVTAGAQYSVSMDVNVLSLTAGQHVVLYVTWRDASGNGLGKVQVTSTTATGVTTLSGNLVAPANTVQAQVTVTVENAGTADLYFDNTQLVAAGTGTLQAISAQLTGLTGATTYHYRTVATSSIGTTFGPDQTFTTSSAGAPPLATTTLATFVGAGGANLNASVNPNGFSTNVVFEYGTTTSYGSQSTSANIGSGTVATPVSIPITGLTPNTTYHYRVDAANANGTTDAADGTFTTTAGPPVVTTGAASGVTTNGATIGGTVDPQFQTTTAYFQYGTSPSYGSQTSTQTMPGNLVPNPGCGNGTTTGWSTDGTAPATFQSQTGWASVGPASCRFTTATIPSGGYSEANVSPYIKNVTAGAQYSVSMDVNVLSLTAGQHVVLYVTWRDASGNGLGKVQVTSTTATGVTTLSGNLVAPANTVQAQVTVTVENAGTADLYFDNAQLVAAGTGTLQAISAQLTGLTGATTYHYRTVATSSIGTTFSPDQTFTTRSVDTTPPTSTATSPAFANSNTIQVRYTAADNPGGWGLAEVDLYAQAPGQSGYTKVASDTSGQGSGSFTYTASGGDGTYNFYTVATDQAGNVQATPNNPQTSTLLDTAAPTSTATSPTYNTSGSWNVSFTASDNQGGSGLAEVDLYAKAPGQTSYTKVGSVLGSAGSGSFPYTASTQGTYSFYTIATDQAGNAQATPSTPQTTTTLDTTAPTATANSPAYNNSGSWNIAYTASDNQNGSGLSEIDLYAQAPGQTSYTKVASNTSGQGSGTFTYTATAGDGTYNFYTLATDQAGNTQTTPTNPQTTTQLDTQPPTSTASAPGQSNTTTFTVSWTASDNQGGSGVAEVDLYAQAPGQSGYTKVASDTSGHSSGSFSYTATAGNGTYNFYTVATDQAGNVQATPSNPQTSTQVSPANTATTVAAPASGATGTAIAAGSISSQLSGASSGAGGTITFKVFGPQTTAPTTCTTGGATAGTASVHGSGTYNPSAGFTPSSAGTYWWYASYGGDSGDSASHSTCGTGMSSTVVTNGTTTTAGAPATDLAGTAISASSISSKLSGASTSATGTITFKVFGPQTTAPTTCTTGGTTVGTASVHGNNTYKPSSSFTPGTAGDYWWYASYGGDSSDTSSNSGCGSAMVETVVYTATSVANATDTNRDSATTTSSFTIKPNATYLLFVSRNSQSGDSISSITSSGLSPALTTTSFTSITSNPYATGAYQWAYELTTGSGASGTGTLTVRFAKTLGTSQSAIIDLVQIGGNSTSGPIVTGNEGIGSGTASTATANLPKAPAAADAGLVFLSGRQSLGNSAPTATPSMTNLFYSHQSSGSTGVYDGIPATENESLRVGNGVSWGTIALEIAHG